MRILPALMLSGALTLAACSGNFERTGSGAMVGGATGAMAGALCCGDPVNDTGRGAVVGIVVGAIVGFVLDWYSSE